jgi:hypothetical protein
LIEVYLCKSRSRSRDELTQGITGGELAGLAIVCVVAALITSGAQRPDKDDAGFVSVAVFAIDSPNDVVHAVDGIHRNGLPPVEQTFHLTQVYELLIAVLASVTKIPVRDLYYVIFPIFWSVLGVLLHWAALRYFLPGRPALLGIAVTVGVLLLWGDGHHTFGNFTFVRLFQGKAVYVLVMGPAILHAALRYVDEPNRRNWLYLLLHQCTAAGLTTNGLIVAPVAAWLALFARPQPSRSFMGRAAVGTATSLPVFLLAVGMYLRLLPYSESPTYEQLFLGFRGVLGGDRCSLVILGLLLLPALASRASLRHACWLSGYILFAFLFLLCPVTAKFMALTVGNVFSWRILWAFPVPLLLGLTAGVLGSGLLPHRWYRISLLGLWLAAFTVVGPTTVSSHNWSWRNIGKYKVHRVEYEMARHIMDTAPLDGLALVPEPVAVYLCGFHGAPPMVGVRWMYLSKLRGIIGDEEWGMRMGLLGYVSGNADAFQPAKALRLINKMGVATVMFPLRHPHNRFLTDALAKGGFNVSIYAGHVLAVKTGGRAY